MGAPLHGLTKKCEVTKNLQKKILWPTLSTRAEWPGKWTFIRGHFPLSAYIRSKRIYRNLERTLHIYELTWPNYIILSQKELTR